MPEVEKIEKKEAPQPKAEKPKDKIEKPEEGKPGKGKPEDKLADDKEKKDQSEPKKGGLKIKLAIPPIVRTIGIINESMLQLKNRIDSFAQQIEEKRVLSNLSDNLKQLEAKLTDRDFDEAIGRKIILKLNSQLTVEEQSNPEVIIGHLKKAFNESVKISNDLPKSDNVPMKLMFIGPCGDGKTTSLQRIAYQLAVCQKKKVGLISLDTERIGAVSALISFARILDVRCTGVYEPSELKQCLEKFSDLDVLLFDTKGINPLDKSELEELSGWISQISPDKVFLVLSANNRLRDLIEMTHKFLSTVNPEFVFTKLDQTKRYGGIISCSIQTEKPVAYLGWGRDLEDFQKADTNKITDLLF